MTIQEGNTLIALFDGWVQDDKIKDKPFWHPERNMTMYTYPDGFRYHTSYDWLMPVVEKIEQGNYGIKQCRKVVEIYFDDTKEVILKTKEKSRIESLWAAITQFILWYNTNNPKTPPHANEDRKAVKPDEKKEPREKETGVNLILDIIHISWNEHLASLPALDVDPDYLKTLRPGWFEGEERYELCITNNGQDGWVQITKDNYDHLLESESLESSLRVTIVAPQEAENCNHPQNIKVGDYCPACDNDQTKQLIPATPQPVAGEERSRMIELLDWYNGRSCNKLIIQKHVDDFIDLFPNPIAASRPTDAVEFAEWVGNNYNPYYDGEGSIYWSANLREKNYTTAELYQLFLNSKSPNPNK